MTKEEQAALDKVKPICAECKHCFVDDIWGDYECGRTGKAYANNITGSVHTRYRDCEIERNQGLQGSCGKQGIFFEQAPPVKQSWLDKVIAWIK